MLDYDIWLGLAKMSNKSKVELLNTFGNSHNLWNEGFGKNAFKDKLQSALKAAWDVQEIERIKSSIQINNIKVSVYNDDLYPQKLKDIENPPYILFYKGELSKINEGYNISIVGSRNCTTYGLNAAKLIAEDLAEKNINIISGLAAGIDGIAHRAAVAAKGFTCGVLGCGIDIVYPLWNKDIFKDVEINGCIISEFPPGTPPLSQNFPIRNRIISGLCDLLIVVEAGIKSGSLITARLALDQGKDVMAVPGSIFSKHSIGTNKLIKDGAYPFTSLEDVYDIIGIKFNLIEKISSRRMSSLESKIYNTISDNPIHIDDILRICNIDIKQLYEVLFELQLKDEILCLSGNYYVKIYKNI